MKFTLTKIITLTILCTGLVITPASSESPSDLSPEELYQWQMKEYARLTENLKDIINKDVAEFDHAKSNKEKYEWQMHEYKNLRKEIEDLKENGYIKKFPFQEGDINNPYNWQMKEFSRLTSELEDILKEDVRLTEDVDTNEKLYQWQMGEYARLQQRLADIVKKTPQFKAKKSTKNEELLDWQLKEYRRLEESFKDLPHAQMRNK